jgi:hypothetical protein
MVLGGRNFPWVTCQRPCLASVMGVSPDEIPEEQPLSWFGLGRGGVEVREDTFRGKFNPTQGAGACLGLGRKGSTKDGGHAAGASGECTSTRRGLDCCLHNQPALDKSGRRVVQQRRLFFSFCIFAPHLFRTPDQDLKRRKTTTKSPAPQALRARRRSSATQPRGIRKGARKPPKRRQASKVATRGTRLTRPGRREPSLGR